MATQRVPKQKKSTKPLKEAKDKKKVLAHFTSGDKTRLRRQPKASLAKPKGGMRKAQAKVKQALQSQLRRASFIVRLTIDQYNQSLRTEIEHVESSKKQNYLSLDGERLVEFMKECIGSVTNPAHTISSINLSNNTKRSRSTRELSRPKFNLMISDVQVFRMGDPELSTFVLPSEQPFIIKSYFSLQGSDSHLLATEELTFEIKIYAREMESGNSHLLLDYSSTVIQHPMQYTSTAEVHGLSCGLYRLFTLIILHRPIKVGGFQNKTIIQVI